MIARYQLERRAHGANSSDAVKLDSPPLQNVIPNPAFSEVSRGQGPSVATNYGELSALINVAMDLARNGVSMVCHFKHSARVLAKHHNCVIPHRF